MKWKDESKRCFCHIHITDKESKQIGLSVNPLANLCTFIIHKNKIFLINSDKNIYFLSVLDFMSTAKHLPTSSVNVLRFAKVMQHITETALFSWAFPYSSFFLDYHHTGTCSRDSTAFRSHLWWLHNNTVQAKHASTQHCTRKREPSSVFRLTMSNNRKKLPLRLRRKAELEKRTCNGAGAETAVKTARVHKLRRRIAQQHRMRVVFKHSKTLCGLERQHTFKDAVARLVRKVLCDVWHLGVEDGCVAQRQRATCSVPCGTECKHP